MKIQCKVCGDIVEVPTRKWVMKWCACKRIAVDLTGDDGTYRIVGNDEDYEILERS